jgi:hypothetical protein
MNNIDERIKKFFLYIIFLTKATVCMLPYESWGFAGDQCWGGSDTVYVRECTYTTVNTGST